MTTANTFETDEIDDSFPYVLVSSLLGAFVTLAAVWISAATAFAPMVGAHPPAQPRGFALLE